MTVRANHVATSAASPRIKLTRSRESAPLQESRGGTVCLTGTFLAEYLFIRGERRLRTQQVECVKAGTKQRS